jgi:excisionase family DNA binding protein
MSMQVALALTDAQIEQIAARAAELVIERQQADASSPWLDAAGAAEYLACSRDRVYDLVQLRRLAVHRDGRRLLFRRADLDAYAKRDTAT